MSYNRGNDVAADAYAAECSRRDAISDAVELRVSELMEDAEWVAGAIDNLIADADIDDKGVNVYANDLAELILTGCDPRPYIDRLRKIVKAAAYDQAEEEMDAEAAEAKLQAWLGEDSL